MSQMKPVFLRVKQIVGDKKSNPPIDPIIPVSRTSWWAGVRSGIYPTPIKLSARTTVWRAEDIFNIAQKTTDSEG